MIFRAQGRKGINFSIGSFRFEEREAIKNLIKFGVEGALGSGERGLGIGKLGYRFLETSKSLRVSKFRINHEG